MAFSHSPKNDLLSICLCEPKHCVRRWPCQKMPRNHSESQLQVLWPGIQEQMQEKAENLSNLIDCTRWVFVGFSSFFHQFSFCTTDIYWFGFWCSADLRSLNSYFNSVRPLAKFGKAPPPSPSQKGRLVQESFERIGKQRKAGRVS